MDKKSLIGACLFVVVLLMGSLSNVVGYQSVKSTVNDSPLFNARTQKATCQPLYSLTAQYLGKDRNTPISVPFRDSRAETITMIVACIKRMDDASLRRLAFLILYHPSQLRKSLGFDQSFKVEEIFHGLREIRNNPDIDIYSIEKSKDPQLMSNICSLDCTMVWSDRSCWLFLILFSILLIFDVLFFYPISLLLQTLTIG